MPSRIGERISQALLDNKITRAEVKQLIETAKAEPTWTPALKAEVEALITQHGDKFSWFAKGDLKKFLEGTPVKVDLADPKVLDKHATDITWNPVSGGKLYVDDVSYDDVIQGSIANCYMASAFSSLAHADPNIIKNALKDNGDGTYTARFFESQGYGKPMKPVYVTVDGDLASAAPGEKNKYAKARDQSEQWVSVLEKAYAQWKGGYETIGNGGRAGDVFTALTGKQYSYTSTTSSGVLQKIETALAAHKPVTSGTHGKDSGVDYNGTGVYAWHAYSVIGTSKEDGVQYVQLRNPWGKSEHGNDGKDDGIFKMKLEDFTKLYNSVYIGG